MSEIEYLAREAARPLTWVVAPTALVLSLVAWHRSRYRPAIAVLELLRLATVAGYEPDAEFVELARQGGR